MELEEFAADVQRQAHKIMAAANNAGNQRILELAGALCTQAAQMKTQARVQVEQANPDRYDLATLPSVSTFDE